MAPGVTVLDVNLGGMARDSAGAALVTKAQEVNSTPVVLRVARFTTSLDPGAAGMEMDAEATLDRVAGFTLDPRRLMEHLWGGDEVKPVVRVDKEALGLAVDAARADLDRDKQSAVVTLDGAHAEVAVGSPSIALDGDGTAALLRETWPAMAQIQPPAEVIDPDVPTAVARDFQDRVNGQLLAEPVKLVGPNGTVTLEPPRWAQYAHVESAGGTLSLVVDGEALAADLIAATPALNNEPRAASVRFDGAHQLVIDEGEPGRTIDAARLGQRVVKTAATATRTSAIPYATTGVVPPAENVDIRDFQARVSEFSTTLPYYPTRTKNLIHAAHKVSNVIVPPGGTFDLTEVLSPITIEDGYFAAGVITNGIHTLGVGGGLSQMATTSYNAAYFAGFEILDHRQHSVYFTRYPAGRESTIYTGQVNMVFKNDTPYAAIMNSYVENSRLHVDIWSTPHYTVKSWASPRTNVRDPGTTVVTSPECEPSNAGQPGFTITNYRQVFLDDEMVKDEQETWTYKPDNAIKCG